MTDNYKMILGKLSTKEYGSF